MSSYLLQETRIDQTPKSTMKTSSLMVLRLLFLALIIGNFAATAKTNSNNTIEYGADISFPMQHSSIKSDVSLEVFGHDTQHLYNEILQGCIRTYDSERCHHTEERRISRCLHRPQAMKNFTQNGFAKIRTPPELWSLVEEFWKTNSFKGTQENWEFGEMTVNHWDAPTYMVGLYDSNLKGGGKQLEQAVWDAAKSTLEAWTGQRLKGCSLYGVRVYTENSVLVPHVDRVPLISSAIINVAQDVEEPWPLEVIGHDRKAHNISMEPGDMVLYESHSIIHGRPFPLKGKFYANIFVHFEPLGQKEDDVPPYIDAEIAGAEMYKAMMEDRSSHYGKTDLLTKQMKLQVHTHAGNGQTRQLRSMIDNDITLLNFEDDNGWQPIHEAARGGHIEAIHYLLEMGADINAQNLFGATPRWIAENFNGADSDVVKFLDLKGAVNQAPIRPNLPHSLAGDGKLDAFRQLIGQNPRLLHTTDPNGWTPLHEAARGGHIDVVQYLVDQGARLNAQTVTGGTPLWYAAQHNGEDSPVFQYLKSVGALRLGPEL